MSGVTIAGGVAAGVGLAALAGGMIYRNSVQDEVAKIPLFTENVTRDQQSLTAAQETLAASIPDVPAGTTKEQAVAIVRERLGSSAVFEAFTGEGDRQSVRAAQVLDDAFTSTSTASSRAAEVAGGRATAVIKVGEWNVPVVLDHALPPAQHTRQEAYVTTEYNYHYGYDIFEDEYHYHYGPETVTRYRPVDYLSDFSRFQPAHHGIEAARNGAGQLMTNQGTNEEQAVGAAQSQLLASQRELDSARSKEHKTDSAGRIPMYIGGALMAGGAIALATQGVRMLMGR